MMENRTMVPEDSDTLLQRIAALEEALRSSTELDRQQALTVSLLQATLEATADGILVVGQAGQVVSCNGRFIELWRIPADLLALRDDRKLLEFVLDQLADPQLFLQKVESLYSDPHAESFDVLAFKDERSFERYSRPQVLAGVPIGRVWSFRDVTQRRQAEETAARSRQQQLLIAAQAAALAQLSTPLIPLNDQVLVMPLIGTIDSERATQILSTLLEGIVSARARTAIVDITGITVVDSHVAATLLRLSASVRLLGAEVVLTGIRAEVAQTLVRLGIELKGLVTRSTLQAGIAYALS